MKKRILSFAFALLLLSTCFLMTGCFKSNDNYLAVVPTDQYYKATLSYRSQTSSSDYLYNWKVIRKQANICGENRDVIYVEYSFVDNNHQLTDWDRTLLYFYDGTEGHVFSYDGTSWQTYQGSFGDKWSDIYGSMSKPGSFVYEITSDINGRDFPKKLKTATTSEYIEYTFNHDNEKFRISNNPYHVLLYYNFDYETTHIRKEAGFVYGSPTDVIPNLNTITSDMIA